MLDLARIEDPTAFFAGRVHRTTIANWKAGRHPVPQWAIDALRQRWQELDTIAHQKIARIKAGPGRKAGTRNIMAYLARR